jgi:hypothetical protein
VAIKGPADVTTEVTTGTASPKDEFKATVIDAEQFEQAGKAAATVSVMQGVPISVIVGVSVMLST